jgi:hypothetical protein
MMLKTKKDAVSIDILFCATFHPRKAMTVTPVELSSTHLSLHGSCSSQPRLSSLAHDPFPC